MVSSSDSESDSDDCLVYKTTRNVVWSDDEDEKQNAGGIGRDRDDDGIGERGPRRTADRPVPEGAGPVSQEQRHQPVRGSQAQQPARPAPPRYATA